MKLKPDIRLVGEEFMLFVPAGLKAQNEQKEIGRIFGPFSTQKEAAEYHSALVKQQSAKTWAETMAIGQQIGGMFHEAIRTGKIDRVLEQMDEQTTAMRRKNFEEADGPTRAWMQEMYAGIRTARSKLGL